MTTCETLNSIPSTKKKKINDAIVWIIFYNLLNTNGELVNTAQGKKILPRMHEALSSICSRGK
jgi:hypothetical protein